MRARLNSLLCMPHKKELTEAEKLAAKNAAQRLAYNLIISEIGHKIKDANKSEENKKAGIELKEHSYIFLNKKFFEEEDLRALKKAGVINFASTKSTKTLWRACKTKDFVAFEKSGRPAEAILDTILSKAEEDLKACAEYLKGFKELLEAEEAAKNE